MYRLLITLLALLVGLTPGRAEGSVSGAALQGYVRVLAGGREQGIFNLPGEAQAAQAAVGRLAGEGAVPTVHIRAAASPDGRTSLNQSVSDSRAAQARVLVENWLPALGAGSIETESVGEDYETLAALLSDSGIAGAEQARTIIETVPVWVTDGGEIVSSRKKQLMDLRGGRTWEGMREELFPLLQETAITIDFQQDEAQEDQVRVEDAPILIYFPFDDAHVRAGFRTNRASLDRLEALFSDSAPMPGDTIAIVGKASLEGPQAYNQALARRRAEAIRSYIAARWPHYAGVLDIRVAGEPWSEVRAAVAAEGGITDETRSRMLEIIDSDASADRKEARLKAVPGWSTLARALYPTWRATAVVPIHGIRLPGFDTDAAIAGLNWGLPVGTAIDLRPDNLVVPVLKERRRPLRPVLGISTNLIYDITYIPTYGLTSIPSLTLEYYPARSRHFTFGADVEWPMWKHWDRRDFFQIQNITLWTRRYFKTCDERFRGLYLLGSINGARFGVGTGGTGWEGEGLGASVGIGHKWILGRSRFFIDLGIAAGAFYAKYDPYVYGYDATDRYYYDYVGDPDLFVPRNHRWFWAGPTRTYISIGIDLFNRNRK